MSEFLTTREFESWTRGHDAKMDRLMDYVVAQTEINLDNAVAIATLRAKQNESSADVSRRTTWISSIVSAIVGGVVGAFTGRG